MARRRTKTGRKGRASKSRDSEKINNFGIDEEVSKKIKGKPVGTTSTTFKEGRMFGTKSEMADYKKAVSQQKIAAAKQNADIQSKLQKGQNIKLAPFLEQSKTGYYTPKELKQASQKFSEQLPGQYFITGVSKKEDGLDVTGSYRNLQYKFNPKAASLQTSGWKLDIPDTFKKVDDKKYVAPEKEFERSEEYRYTREQDKDDRSRSRTKDEQMSTYVPTEIILGDDKNTIKSVIERGDYMSERDIDKYEESKDDYDYKEYERDKERDVYTRELQDFYDGGVMQSIKRFEPFTKDFQSSEYERERRDKEVEQESESERKDIYKSLDVEYDPEGRSAREQEWGTFYTDFAEKKLEEFNKETEDKQYSKDIYQKRDVRFDRGLKTREEQWSPYKRTESQSETERWGRDKEREEFRETPMKTLDVDYMWGAPTSYKRYEPYEQTVIKRDDGQTEDIDTRRTPGLVEERSYWAPGVESEITRYTPFEFGSSTERQYSESGTAPTSGGPVDVTGRDYGVDRETGQLIFFDEERSRRQTESGTMVSQEQFFNPQGVITGDIRYGPTGTTYQEYDTGAANVYREEQPDRDVLDVETDTNRGYRYYDGGNRGFVRASTRARMFGPRRSMLYNPQTRTRYFTVY